MVVKRFFLCLFFMLAQVFSGLSYASDQGFMKNSKRIQLMVEFKNKNILTSLNIDEHFPTIVVAGTQGHGKSATLSRLLNNVELMSAQGACTRVPTEIHSRYDPGHSLKTLLWIDGFTHKKEAAGSPEEVSAVFSKLQEIILKKEGHEFSKTPIHIEVSGRNQPDITLVDLPGLQTSGKHKDIIQEINEVYLQRENVLVVAVTSLRVDPETGHGLGLLSDYNAQKGSVLVMSNGDYFDPMDQVKNEYIRDLLRGENTIVNQKSGYRAFILANKSSAGQSLSEKEEESALSHAMLDAFSIAPEQAGIKALRQHLEKSVEAKISRGQRLRDAKKVLEDDRIKAIEEIDEFNVNNRQEARVKSKRELCEGIEKEIRTIFGVNKEIGRLQGESYVKDLENQVSMLKSGMVKEVPVYKILHNFYALIEKMEELEDFEAKNPLTDKKSKKSAKKKKNATAEDPEAPDPVEAERARLRASVNLAYDTLTGSYNTIIEKTRQKLLSTTQISGGGTVHASVFEDLALGTIDNWKEPAEQFVQTMLTRARNSVDSVVSSRFRNYHDEDMESFFRYLIDSLFREQEKNLSRVVKQQFHRETSRATTTSQQRIEVEGHKLAVLLEIDSDDPSFKERFLEAVKANKEKIKVILIGGGVVAGGAAVGAAALSSFVLPAVLGLGAVGGLGLMATGQGRMVGKVVTGAVSATATVGKKAGGLAHKKWKKAGDNDAKNKEKEKPSIGRYLSFHKSKISKKDQKLKRRNSEDLTWEQLQDKERLLSEEKAALFDQELKRIVCKASAYDMDALERVLTIMRQLIVSDFIDGILKTFKVEYEKYLFTFQKNLDDKEEFDDSVEEQRKKMQENIRNITDAINILSELEEIS